MQRSSRESIQSAYEYIFKPSNTLDKLKESAVAGRLPHFRDGTGSDDEMEFGKVGRSIMWKIFLVPVAPLTSTLCRPPTPLIRVLADNRAKFAALVKEKMQAPDGSYEEGITIPGEMTPPRQTTLPRQDWDKNNPLSLDDENPWQEWFQTVELRKTIAQDVERTFPDILYFRQPHVQTMLVTILFLYTLDNPSIGYRQGMHEILAPILYALDYDSVLPDTSNDAIDPDVAELCNRRWIAADASLLFRVVMQGAGTWFEWKEPAVGATTNGPMPTAPWIAPIVSVCNGILADLRTVDPALWTKMCEANIEPQIYGIRWLRLLFSREFDLYDVMPLWDAMFAADPTLDIAKWICIAMLLRIRNKLIPGDYSGQLTTLLRYPGEPPVNDFDSPHTALLVRQALAIRAAPTPATGVSIVMENRNLLGIPVEVPEPDSPPRRRRPQSHIERPRAGSGNAPIDLRKDYGALQDLISSRLQDANTALMSTVSELRRNLPELPASIIRSPTSPEATAFPYQHVVRGYEERVSRDPRRSRLEMEREISQINIEQKKLAQALDWSLDVLHKGVDLNGTAREEALDCISYVRDALRRPGVGNLDEGKMLRWGVAPDDDIPQGAPRAVSDPLQVAPPPYVVAQPTRPADNSPTRLLNSAHDHPSVALPRTTGSPFNTPSSTLRHPNFNSLSASSNHRPSYSTSTLPNGFGIARPGNPTYDTMASKRASVSPATRLSPHTPPLRGTLTGLRSPPPTSYLEAAPSHSNKTNPSQPAFAADPLGALK